jgi:hypothetical protein
VADLLEVDGGTHATVDVARGGLRSPRDVWYEKSFTLAKKLALRKDAVERGFTPPSIARAAEPARDVEMKSALASAVVVVGIGEDESLAVLTDVLPLCIGFPGMRTRQAEQHRGVPALNAGVVSTSTAMTSQFTGS